jgi:hypothetical protein
MKFWYLISDIWESEGIRAKKIIAHWKVSALKKQIASEQWKLQQR